MASDRTTPNIVNKIFAAGAQKGFSPRQMCKKIGTHPNYSTQIHNPTLDTLESLATVAGGHIDFIEGK